ncbi:hypothetical protein Tco_1385006 [Tanacetum coccineum]
MDIDADEEVRMTELDVEVDDGAKEGTQLLPTPVVVCFLATAPSAKEAERLRLMSLAASHTTLTLHIV